MTYIILGLWLSVSLLIVIVANAVCFSTATVNVIENLEEENAKLRAELSELKNYRGE